jgi:hypothetical protein
MKKLVAIPLLVLYLVAISGTMLQLHFCGSRLSSWNVNNHEAGSCCCGDGDGGTAAKPGGKANLSKDNCCSDKVITLKIAQDQNTAYNLWQELKSVALAVLPDHALVPASDIPATPHEPAYRANAPPGLWQGIPLYKLHSRFTYYG